MTPPIDLRPDHAKIVRDIIARYLPGGVSVRVFGSRAKWTAKTHSDLDLVVKGKGPLPRSVLSDVAEAFSESDLPFRVDVVDWHSVAPSFQNVIDRDGKTLGWPLVTLGEVASQITVGHVGSMANEYVAAGIPFLRSLNIEPYRISLQDLKFISPEFHKRLRKSALKPGDVVIIRTGKPGVCSVIPDWLTDANCSDLVIVRCGDDIHPRYLAYWVNSLAAHHIGSNLVGAVQQHFNVASARQMPISLPPRDEQDRILSVLATMDDKIELNRLMNATLERQAQAVFRDWFVDFGPVRRKQAGEADPVAIMGGLTPDRTHATHLAALFPDALGDDGLPVGWAMTPFSSVVTIIGGGTPKTSIATYWDGDIPWFSVADTPAGADTFVLDTEKRITRAGLKNSSARIIPAGTTIITARGTVGNLAVAGREMTFNQSCYALQSADGERPYFVYLATSRAIEQLQSMAHGSVFSTITRQTFDSVPIAKAGYEMIEMFEQIVTPLFERIKANAVENRTLAETRDYLLPRLMSGTVRVVPQDRAA